MKLGEITVVYAALNKISKINGLLEFPLGLIVSIKALILKLFFIFPPVEYYLNFVI